MTPDLSVLVTLGCNKAKKTKNIIPLNMTGSKSEEGMLSSHKSVVFD